VIGDYDDDYGDHDLHDCSEEHCGDYWCDRCEDWHWQNDLCDETGYHPEYCGCSDCQPDRRPIVTIVPGEVL